MSDIITNNLQIEQLIYIVRGEKVMLDSDLALIYGIQTKVLNQAVKRNIDRFPNDFMFQLTVTEWEALRSQIVTFIADEKNLRSQPVTLNEGRGKHRKYLPYVFTEHGAVMLASILNSPQAIAASIQVVRVFIKVRQILATHKQLAKKLEELENKYDSQFKEVFDALRGLMSISKETSSRIILKKGVKE